MRVIRFPLHAVALAIALAVPALAAPQAPPLVPYGAPVTSELARKIAAGALAEGRKNGWAVAAAIVDTGGILVHFDRVENTQNGSSEVAIEKARTSALFRRPSKAFEDTVLGGKTQYLRLPGTVPIEGGLPIVVDGKIVGAVGVSGATSAQDAQCAKAGLDAATAK